MRSVSWILLLVLGMALTGCSREDETANIQRPAGDVPTGSPATQPSTPPSSALGTDADGPAAAYRAWIAALAAKDAATACVIQAPELTIELRYEAILVERAELGDPCVGFEALLWEDPAFDPEIVAIEVTQETAEDALLAVELSDSEQTVRMIRHRAHWRVAATSPRAADPPSSGADPVRWVERWCDLDASMDRTEIIDVMGPPSGEYTVANGGEPQLWWAQDQYDFRVYLDIDDTVLELVGDYDALSATDRASLDCAELRN